MSGLLTLGPYRALSGPSSRPHPLIRTRSFGTEVCQEETNCPDLVGPHSIGSAFPRLSARLPTLLLLQRVRDHPESVAPRSCTSSGRRSKRSGSCHGHSRLLTRCTAQCDAPRDRSADILENLRGPTGVPFGPDRPCEVRGPEGQLRDGGRPHREFKIHSKSADRSSKECSALRTTGVDRSSPVGIRLPATADAQNARIRGPS